MKIKILLLLFTGLFFFGCVGVGSKGIFGTGVSVAFDPRSVGTQIDDSIMQKNLTTRMILKDKKYILSVNSKVLDGRIFLTGKVDNPEDKLRLTKLAWETDGVRSVRNDLKVKEQFNFKQSAKDVLITSQLRTALILNKNVKASNFNIDTVNQKTYIFGIAKDENEKKEIIQESKQIVDLKELISSILMVSDLSRQRE